ncbi:AAA family ATPase [Kiritimatiellaeota bacterium B1221]|nr:AAA family ATPase [Kiritimatiellaeota bacterium B1221]
MTTETLTEKDLKMTSEKLAQVRRELNQVLFGQEALIDQVVICLLARGHLLLEGLPGLGKTELVRALSQVLGLESKRIQFTPDLLPGDITGNPMLQDVDGERKFIFQPGPLFSQLVLADEINRASPKTQSALLEAMQEHRVTSMGERHTLPEPFFVLATQNPIELEGTYPLPEAQLDRFLFKLHIQAGGADVLQRIVENRQLGEEAKGAEILKPQELQALMQQVKRIYLPEVVSNYIARLVHASHKGESEASKSIKYGASPRAAIGLAAAGRARALMQGRENVSYEDIKAVVVPVLQHRLVLEYHAKLEGLDGSKVAEALVEEVPAHADKLPPVLKEG